MLIISFRARAQFKPLCAAAAAAAADDDDFTNVSPAFNVNRDLPVRPIQSRRQWCRRS